MKHQNFVTHCKNNCCITYILYNSYFNLNQMLLINFTSSTKTIKLKLSGMNVYEVLNKNPFLKKNLVSTIDYDDSKKIVVGFS